VTDPVQRLSTALADRYTIEREVGAGGMARVYRAADLRHDRCVAIKVFRPELVASLGVERFLREIRIAAKLQHPHILPLFDSGAIGDLLFYVMPFVDGETLRHRLTRERQLPVEEALHLTREIGDALGYAHGLGIVHRDVKPENVLLAGGHALVADFGIAYAVSAAGGPRITGWGIAIGTPDYMSPEQAMAEPTLDGRSDQYSLACVLYEMLAGEPPFTGQTAQVTIMRRLTDPMPSLRAARDTVPESIEGAIRRALARAPADRFATVTAFVEALSAPAGAQPRPRSVAVLPFVSLSADPDNEYFADGITEDVIAQLAKIRALEVVSRTSVMPFKGRPQGLREIAARLQVATLLEGSVRRVGDRVRIVAQLIDAATDQPLWAETYDRQLTDIFAIQTEVALHIADALAAELSPDEKTRLGRGSTRDLRAYQLYLQGRNCFIRYTADALHEAIRYFEQAIARDSRYALAHASVGMAFLELGETGGMRPEEAYPRAVQAATRALALDPELGEAQCVAAFGKVVIDFDWAGAEAQFKRALELSPSSPDTYDLYGRLCSALERYDEALAMQARAQELDPLAHPADVATTLLRAGRYDEALEAARRAIALGRDSARGHATLGWAYCKLGRVDEGLAALERAVTLSPGDSLWLAQLGQACGLAGKADRAREILGTLEAQARTAYVAPYHLAYVYTGLGQFDDAMEQLEQAFERHAGAMYGVRGSFLFAPLRPHPRFQALLRRMHLV